MLKMNNLNVLIDPSLLLDEVSLRNFVEYLRQRPVNSEEETFFVSSTFFELLNDVENNMKEILFFSNISRMANLKKLKTILENEKINKFELSPDFSQESESIFYENLLQLTKNKKISQILFEEWIFLQNKSWVVSKLKKSFNYFIRSGAVSIEFGAKSLDYAVRITLKKKNQKLITNADRLRALGKWIAIGGSAATSHLVDPILSVVGALITGIFFLIDPDLIE